MSARPELILAVDTSGADAGVVLAGGGRVDTAFLASRPGGFARTEDLAAEAGALLAARGCTARDLTLLGAVVGPGSYTGLRSGLAFLRGLAFADSLPAVAVGTLELLAWRGARAGEAVVAVSPAGPGRYAAAAYGREDDSVGELLVPLIVEEEECAAFLAESGRGCAAVVVAAAPAPRAPDGSAFAGATHRSPLAGLSPLPDAARLAGGRSPLADAARRVGLELRVAGPDALEQLALLVGSRSRRAPMVSIETLLPIYVGHTSARPNRHRVAVLGASE